jgi:hypothetical protein
MSRRCWSRRRRWCRLPAPIAAEGDIGDGVGPPVPVAAGERGLLGRWGEMHDREVTRENEKTEKNEWMSPGGRVDEKRPIYLLRPVTTRPGKYRTIA